MNDTNDDTITRLNNLKQLVDKNFITAEEYEVRRLQIINEVTGTQYSNSSSITNISGDNDAKHNVKVEASNIPLIVFHPPPNFTNIPEEKAFKYCFDIDTRKWNKTRVKVKIDTTPFARGSIRFCYHLYDETSTRSSFVAKMSFDPKDNINRAIYFQDIEMQVVARKYAQKFNQYNPPKIVDFVKAWTLELLQRPGHPIIGVEKYIPGEYRKHNNNFGYVNDDERNTPQAFSHFSYIASNKTLLICDLQGVGDLYTDPQIHSHDGKEYGKGNLGRNGIELFLKSHRCNAICQYLKLPLLNPLIKKLGTLPAKKFMSYNNVEHMPETPEREIFDSSLISPQTPLLSSHDNEKDQSSDNSNDKRCVCCNIQ